MPKCHNDTFGREISGKGSGAFGNPRFWQGNVHNRGFACEFGVGAAFLGGFPVCLGLAHAMLLSQDPLLNKPPRNVSAERGEAVTGYYFHPRGVAEIEVEALSHTQIKLQRKHSLEEPTRISKLHGTVHQPHTAFCLRAHTHFSDDNEKKASASQSESISAALPLLQVISP